MADKREYGVKRIIAQDSHRNGVGGATAVVTLFEPEPYDEDEELGVFVAISFPVPASREPSDYAIKRYGGIREARTAQAIESFRVHTYAVSLAELEKGNIEFAAGNSWRAADHWGPEIAEAYRESCLSGDFSFDPFDDEDYIERDADDDKPASQMLVEKINEDLDSLYEQKRELAKAITRNEQRLEAAQNTVAIGATA